MGRASRERPVQLPKKLLQIRTALDLSQNEMLEKLEMSERAYRTYISGFELGQREPSLIVLMKYARLANVVLDALVDDEIELPKSLPAKKNYRWALNRF